MASNLNSDLADASEDTVKDHVVDEAGAEQQSHKRFQITSYGADMTVFELTHRLGKDLIIPGLSKKICLEQTAGIAIYRVPSGGITCTRYIPVQGSKIKLELAIRRSELYAP